MPYNEKFQILNKAIQSANDSLGGQYQSQYSFVVGRAHALVSDKTFHPYLNVNEWKNGWLLYENTTYPVDFLKYDIVNDDVVFMFFPNSQTMHCVALDKNFLKAFGIQNQTFRYYSNLIGNKVFKPKDGYYEVVYDGNVKFLVRHDKSKTFSGATNATKNLDASLQMFVLKGDSLVVVRSSKSLVNHLDNSKRELVMDYIKQNSLRLKKSNYSSAVLILKFYEENQGQ